MVAPKLSSVINLVNGDTITAHFDQAMDRTGVFLDTSSYSLTGGLTVTGVALVGANSDVQLTVFPEMKTGAAYVLTASNSLKNAALETMDAGFLSGAFTGVGVDPDINDVAMGAARKFRVSFTEAMKRTPALLASSSYIVVGSTPGAQPVVVIGVTTGNEANPTYVDVEVTDMTQDGTYQLQAAGLSDVVGNVAALMTSAFTAVGDAPGVIEVKGISKNRVDVKFSENMLDNTSIRTKTKYNFDNGLSVVSVAGVDGDTVQLVTTDQTPGVLYTLTVTP